MSNEKLTNEQIELIQQQVLEIMEDLDPTKGRLIQIKQGPRIALAVDSLMIGEPCYLTDDKILVIGTGNGYIEFPNQEAFGDFEVSDGSITSDKLSQALNDMLIDLQNSVITVNDTLTSDSISEALSAKQGKELKKLIDDLEIPEQIQVINSLTSDSITNALSAKQGKELKASIDALEQNQDNVNVVDNLTSTSNGDALSANQGRILDGKIQNLIDNGVNVNVIDALNSNSTLDALSANQGRLLELNKADKTLANANENGLMSSSQFNKLDGVEVGANKTIVTDNLNSNSNSNALSANQGKILNDKIQDLIDNPVGTTINDTLSSEATNEALSAKQGKVLNDNQNNHIIKTAKFNELGHVYSWEQGINIPTSTWNGTTAPYTATISLPNIKSTDNPLISPIYNVDYTIALNQRNNYAKIDDATTSTGTITFRCLEEKPDIQLTLLVKVVGT